MECKNDICKHYDETWPGNCKEMPFPDVGCKAFLKEPPLKTQKEPVAEVPCSAGVMCKWVKGFDGHFNISCVGETGQRANYDFKGRNAKWEFKYCPYCGREIEEKST